MKLQTHKVSKFSLFAVGIFGVFSFGGIANANSILTTQFFGIWLNSNVACADPDKSTALQFSHDSSGDYVFVGQKKCKLKINDTKDELEVANKDRCLKSGFPDYYIGKYTLNLGGGVQIYGHMIMTNIAGQKVALMNCEVHQPL